MLAHGVSGLRVRHGPLLQMIKKKLLNGVRILDLSRILAGPWATQLLADYGAEVIKVERPTQGDDTRNWGPPWKVNQLNNQRRDAAYFFSTNRNKRSLTCDFSTQEGAAIVKDLVKYCDVVIENFKVGTLRKFKLNKQELKKIKPDLIYCSITAYAEDSNQSHQPGYDAMIQASAGLMSITGEKDGKPQKVGVAIADIMAGMYAVSAILASLYQREQNGEIQDINVPLFDSQVSWLANQNMNYLIGGINPTQEGTAHPNIAPYQVFPTKDEDIMLAVGNDNQFERLIECFGGVEENLINKFNKNSQRVENKEELINFLSERLKMHSASYWLTLFDEKSIPCGPINDIAQVFNSDYAKEQNLVRYGKNKHNKKIPTVANPIRFSDYDTQYDNAAPTLGEHTNLILKKLLNYTDEEIKILKVKNII